MTVCIAALADGGKAAVLASDKMISKQMPPIEYEHDIDKIVEVFENFFILVAGTVNNAADIIDLAKTKLKISDSYLQKFEKTKEAYVEFRRSKIESAIIRAQGFDSLNDFKQRQATLSKEIAVSIQNLIGQANLQTVMTLVAVEGGRCYIKILSHPGDLINPLEYATIGSGELHASQSLIGAKYKKSETIDAASYLVFEAKKRAEVAPGVGELTDMIVLYHDPTGALKKKKLDVADLKKLENVFNTVNKRDAATIQSLLTTESFHV